MRIGNLVPLISCKAGYENNVSGHAQVPLRSVELFAQAGHEVELITNAPTADRPAMPRCLPPAVALHFVPDGRRRKKVVNGVGGHSRGLRPGAMIRQLRAIVAICRERRFDLLHLHGSIRTAFLARMLGLAGLEVPTVITVSGAAILPRAVRPLFPAMRPRDTAFITATEFVARECARLGAEATVVRHGPIRDLGAEAAAPPDADRRRILFWRDPSRDNGCDIALAAFERLAPRYPHLSFELAIRPYWDEVPGIYDLSRRHPNVRIHRFPYPPGTTIAGLVRGSLCVLLPFRLMSIDPQLVILESLSAGVPVVATSLRSNAEIIRPGVTGDLVPVGDARAAADAVERLIQNPARALDAGRAAQRDVAERWNWSGYVREADSIYRRLLGAPAAESREATARGDHPAAAA